jgi:hypothetical protein
MSTRRYHIKNKDIYQHLGVGNILVIHEIGKFFQKWEGRLQEMAPHLKPEHLQNPDLVGQGRSRKDDRTMGSQVLKFMAVEEEGTYHELPCCYVTQRFCHDYHKNQS